MKRKDVFEKLEPPKGGLLRLRLRLDDGERSAKEGGSGGPGRVRMSARRVLWLAAAVAVLPMVVFVMLYRRPLDLVSMARQRGGATEIDLGLVPSPEARVALGQGQDTTAAITRVPTSSPNVTFYWVASTSDEL